VGICFDFKPNPDHPFPSPVHLNPIIWIIGNIGVIFFWRLRTKGNLGQEVGKLKISGISELL